LPSRLVRFPQAFLLILGLTSLGCGDSGEGGPAAEVVIISAATGPLAAGYDRQFRVTIDGDTSDVATWVLVEGAAAGAITAGGLYIATNTPGTYHIAALAGSPAGADTATIEVLGNPPFPQLTLPDSIDVRLAPATASVVPVDGVSYEWEVAGGSVVTGQGTPSVTVTAPETATQVTIIIVFRNLAGLEQGTGDAVPVIGQKVTMPGRGEGGVAASTDRVAYSDGYTDSVRVFNLAGRGRAATFAVTDPGPLAFDDSGDALFVGRPGGIVQRFALGGSVTGGSVGVGPYPVTVFAMTSGGTALYAGTRGRVVRVDPATLAVVDSVDLPVSSDETTGLALAGDGSVLWVAVAASGKIYRLRPDSLSIIDSATVAGSPQGIAVNSDGSYIYVSNLTLNPAQGYTGLQVVRSSDRLVEDVPNAPAARAVALTPDGAEAWLGGQEPGNADLGRITRYNTTTRVSAGLERYFDLPTYHVTFDPSGLFVAVGTPGQAAMIRR
jgi:DNA-binding beta-propeller fold protein YncE